MAESYDDKVDRVLRDHQGYTGDGQGGQGALPTGDRATARKLISNRDLRQLLKESDGAMNIGEANRYTDERAAELEADVDAANAHTDARADALQTDIDAVRDIAFDQAKIYPTTAAGIAATIVGQEFSVQSTDPNIALRVYRHEAGGVATLIATTPSVAALTDKASLDALAKAVGATYGVATAAGLSALTPSVGETAITADTGFIHRWDGSAWVDTGESPLTPIRTELDVVSARSNSVSTLDPTLWGASVTIDAEGYIVGVSVPKADVDTLRSLVLTALKSVEISTLDPTLWSATVIVDADQYIVSGGSNSAPADELEARFDALEEEMIGARALQVALGDRLGRSFDGYGNILDPIWGRWLLRETRMRIRKRKSGVAEQLIILAQGDSYTAGGYWTREVAK